jgi:transposase
METVIERPSALDVHKEQVTACVRVPGEGRSREQHVAEFPTTVAGLLTLRDWLAAFGVRQVVMEATGVYWKPVWAILEDEFECLLVNARHVKQVPGRKTDVRDAEWLCQLAEAGLLRASFVPPKPIRALRNLTRYRKTQIQERAREANRLHKALEDTGIKLDCVASDILGKSGRAMLTRSFRARLTQRCLLSSRGAGCGPRSRRSKKPWRAASIISTPSGSERSLPTWTSWRRRSPA